MINSNSKRIFFSLCVALMIFLLASFAGADDHGNTYSSATLLATDGALLTGSFEIEKDVDYFRFRAVSGNDYVIETSDLGDGCDTYIYLLGPDGTTPIAENDDGGFVYNLRTEWRDMSASKITWTASDTDTYYVKVKHFDSSGNGAYKISITETPKDSDDHGNTHSSATSLATDGNQVSGSFEVEKDVEKDVDYFSFQAVSGNDYVIETSNLEGECDTHIYLFGPDGTTQIAEDDDHGFVYGSKIEWQAVSSETFYIKVRNYITTGSGTYQISVRQIDNAPELLLLTGGQPYSGSLSATNDYAIYTIDINGNETLTVNLDSPSGSTDSDLFRTDFDLYVRLGAPPTLNIYDDTGISDYADETCSVSATSPTTAYIMVRSYAGSGDYAVTAHAETRQDQVSLKDGEAYSNSLSAANDYDIYTIDIDGNETLTVNLDGHFGTADFDLYVRLGAQPTLGSYDERGYSGSAGETCSVNVSSPTTAYIMVKSYTGSGDYSVTASSTIRKDAVVLTEGQPYSDSLSATNDYDIYTIDIDGGETLAVKLDGHVSESDFDLYVRLGAPPTLGSYDDKGYSGTADETCSVSATSSTTAYIMVRSDYGNGSYSLKGSLSDIDN